MKVGVTFRNYGPRDKSGKPLYLSSDFWRENDYISFVFNSGHVPVIITEVNPESIDECDALLLCGGVDIHPGRYGIEPDFPKENYDVHFDQLEHSLLDYCIASGRPVFGICRGHQMISLYLRDRFVPPWTWIQDFNNHKKPVIKGFKKFFTKKPIIRGKDLYHEVFDLSNEKVIVNSSHHQGMASSNRRSETSIGPIIITHVSSDLIIEGLEFPRLKIKSVQWHPERFIDPQFPNKNGTPEILKDFLERYK